MFLPRLAMMIGYRSCTRDYSSLKIELFYRERGPPRGSPSCPIRPEFCLQLVHEALHVCVDAVEQRRSAGDLRCVRDRRLGCDGELVLEVSWLDVLRWRFGKVLNLQVLTHIRPPEAVVQGDLDVRIG